MRREVANGWKADIGRTATSEYVFRPLGCRMAHEKRLEDHAAGEIADAYRAIGRFLTSMSDVDLMLSDVLAAVTAMNGLGHSFIVHAIDFNRKREILKAFGKQHDRGALPDDYRRLLKELDAADALMKDRNIVAHGMLIPIDGELQVLSMTLPALTGHVGGTKPAVKVAELDAKSVKADKISQWFTALVDRLDASRKA